MSRPASLRPTLAPLSLAALLLLVLALGGRATGEPVPVPDAELAANTVGFGGGGSGDDEDEASEPFDIDDSATDLNLYALDCFQASDATFVQFRTEAYASTVANRSAHYLAVDVKLEANGVVRSQDFHERDGPTSAVSTSVSYTAPCNDYGEFWSVTADGWHKGIGDRGDLPIYETSSDR